MMKNTEIYETQSEALNCLEEARSFASSLSVEAEGSGPFRIYHEKVYYCKSTDAVAGSYTILDERFETVKEADARFEELSDGWDEYEGPRKDYSAVEAVEELDASPF